MSILQEVTWSPAEPACQPPACLPASGRHHLQTAQVSPEAAGLLRPPGTLPLGQLLRVTSCLLGLWRLPGISPRGVRSWRGVKRRVLYWPPGGAVSMVTSLRWQSAVGVPGQGCGFSGRPRPALGLPLPVPVHPGLGAEAKPPQEPGWWCWLGSDRQGSRICSRVVRAEPRLVCCPQPFGWWCTV